MRHDLMQLIRSTRHVRTGLTVAGCLVLAVPARAQGRAAQPVGADSALLQRMLEVEDARVSDSASLAPILAGLKSPDVTTRRIAVRGIGRMERIDNVAFIQSLVTDPSPVIRAEALNAIAQILKGDAATAGNEGAAADRRMRAIVGIQGLIRGLVASESDPMVRGVIARTLGRLPYPTEDVARGATESIAALIDGIPNDGALAREPWFGIAHGTDALLRRFPNLRNAPGVLRVANIPRVPSVVASASGSDSSWSRETNVILAAIRGRVLGAVVGSATGADDASARSIRARLLTDFGDADAQVRRQVVASIAVAAAVDDSARARIVNAALGDPSPSVRVEAVRAYARKRGASCAPLITASRDANAHVALTAIDALVVPCDPSSAAVTRLAALVRELPRGPTSRSAARGTWHPGAHAIVSLARVAPDSAKAALPRFTAHPVWQVRMYAARAEGEVADTAGLRKLATDQSDNVRDAAVASLSALVHPGQGGAQPRIPRSASIDSIFVAELTRPDHQLVLDAARALEGAERSSRIGDALFAALERLTKERRENSRDPRMELLARIEALASAQTSQRLTPYLADYDPAIAQRASRVLDSWTTAHCCVSPKPLPSLPVSLADVVRLRNARVRITMAPESGGGSFEMRLFPDEAPATINRFVTLARRGYYNGLTFHRVATNFVIQGGSPGANEYVGDARFMRDELTLRSHERGTLGISTRGRDTGDAQIFVNLIDNWRLDHDYTVFAEVVKGMDVVDNVIEGDVIARIEILGSR